MQPPPQSGYGNYPQNGPVQPQSGPRKGPPQGYAQGGDNLSAQLGNMQIGGQSYRTTAGGYSQQPNGQQYSNGQQGPPLSNQQPFRPPSTNTSLNQGHPNGLNGPHPSPQASGPPQTGLPAHGMPQMRTPQAFAQGGHPPLNSPSMSGAPQGGGPPAGLPQFGGPIVSPSHPSGPPQGTSHIGAPPSGPSHPGAQSTFQGPPPPGGFQPGPPSSGGFPQGAPQPGGFPQGPPQSGAVHPGTPQSAVMPPTGGYPVGPPSIGGLPAGCPQAGGQPPAVPHPSGHGAPFLPQSAHSQSNMPGAAPGMSGGHPGGQQQARGPPQMSGPAIGASPIGAPPLGPGQGPTQGLGQGPPQGLAQGPPQGLAQGPPLSQNPYGSNNNSAGPTQRPAGFPPGGPPQNAMMPPMSGQPPTGAQNGLHSGPTSAFQPPPQSQGPPIGPSQGYNMGSPMSPPGQYNAAPMGQGYAQSPPSMFNQQQNGQYPPMQQPQQMQAPGGYPQQPQSAPQRKLDPDHMPSPIQVIEDDRKAAGQVFGTSRLGTLPPLVTTDVEIQDEGNAGPNYIRSTVYSVPCSPDVIKQTQVPLAVAITPFARHARSDGVLPLSVFNEEVVRCNRCKAYMCPFMQFMDGGRRFQCVFCKATTEVPQNYFNHLDHNGARVDKWQRAELCLGSYEILATQEYCKNNVFPKAPPALIFVLDVSYNAIKNGMVHLFCQNIKDILEDLPVEEDDQNGPPAVRVGFITYSSQVHFYNIDPTLSNPQMMVVPDVVDMFVPFLEGCLVKPSEAMHVIESLCEEIPKMFQDTRETETILGPAIQAGMEALKAAECPGKLFVFHTTMPTIEAPGKLKSRDDRKLLGTEKEKTVLAPACPYYQELAVQCVQVGCSVDLFVANNSFVDVASIGQVAKISGGEIYKYTYFQADTDGERFLSDLRRDVARPIAFDAVMRVRTSTGLRPTDFYGNFYMQNTTDVELGSIDCDKCITVEMKYDDKLPEGECAYIQVALLYTSVKGVRKLRLHNLCLQTTNQMADMFRNCELDTILNLFCKQGLRQLMDGNPKALRDALTLRASTILANYRKHCATASSSGQLILPECMKLMPLYVCCMMKSDALSGGPELTVDDRAYAMLCLGSMDVNSSQVYLYPRLLAVHNLDPSDNTMPSATRTTVEKIHENEAYILENGVLMFLYIGLQINPGWCESIFGVSSPVQIEVERQLPVLNNPQSKHLHELIASVRNERQRFMKLYVVRQGDKLERVLRQFLVEDRMSDAQPSYVDYLCQLHREIRNLI